MTILEVERSSPKTGTGIHDGQDSTIWSTESNRKLLQDTQSVMESGYQHTHSPSERWVPQAVYIINKVLIQGLSLAVWPNQVFANLTIVVGDQKNVLLKQSHNLFQDQVSRNWILLYIPLSQANQYQKILQFSNPRRS